jgi:hypothetical protein
MAKKIINGLKLIKHNAAMFEIPDDPAFPYKLELSLQAPKFLEIAYVGIFGSTEDVVVRAMTQEALQEFMEMNDFRKHPRLRSFVITGPDGIIEEFKK